MAKIILLFLGLALAYWILKSYRRRVDRRESQKPAAGSEDMVRCACAPAAHKGARILATIGGLRGDADVLKVRSLQQAVCSGRDSAATPRVFF